MGNKPLINDELLPGGVVKGDKILGLSSAGWTNERHSTYISSMEASFVEQLYGLDNHRIDAKRSHLGGNGFKVIRDAENLLIRRFRPRNAGVNFVGDGAEDLADDYGSGTDTVREKVRTHGREVKGFVEETLIEVSDQNFSEEVDVEANDEPFKKKRPTSRALPNDQLT